MLRNGKKIPHFIILKRSIKTDTEKNLRRHGMRKTKYKQQIFQSWKKFKDTHTLMRPEGSKNKTKKKLSNKKKKNERIILNYKRWWRILWTSEQINIYCLLGPIQSIQTHTHTLYMEHKFRFFCSSIQSILFFFFLFFIHLFICVHPIHPSIHSSSSTSSSSSSKVFEWLIRSLAG